MTQCSAAVFRQPGPSQLAVLCHSPQQCPLSKHGAHLCIPRCTHHTLQCTMHSLQCTIHSLQCTMHSLQCTVHSLQCRIHTVQCSTLPRAGLSKQSYTRPCVPCRTAADYPNIRWPRRQDCSNKTWAWPLLTRLGLLAYVDNKSGPPGQFLTWAVFIRLCLGPS